MGLNQSTSRYWLAIGTIVLAWGVSTAISEIALWTTIQSADLTSVPRPRTPQFLIFLIPALGSLPVVLVASLFLLRVKKIHKEQTEDRFRHIFEGAAIGIGLDNLDGTIVESNPALQEMLGYSQDELAQMNFAAFTHPDDLAADVELFGEMISGKRDSYQIEKRHRRRDGHSFWVRLTNSVVKKEDGLPEYTIAVVEDITPLKQAQESIQLYADIVKRMPFGLLVWHLEVQDDQNMFTLVECNPAACQFLQFQAEADAMIGRSMTEVFPDLINTAFPKIYADVIRSGNARDLGEVCYGDGTFPTGIFATKAIPLPNQCVGLLFEDITERKQAEEALLQSEARFRVVAETASCAFLVYQGNHLRYVNPAAETITEYTRDELVSVNFWELAHPDFRDLVRERGLARQRGEAIPRRYEIKILTKTGKERWVDMTAGSAYLDGQPAALATAYDITERKAAEAQLQLAANRERLLSETALRIRSSLNLEEILNTTVAEVRQFLQADRVFIAHLEPGTPCCTVAESVDPKLTPSLGWVLDSYAAEEIRQLFEPDTVRVINDTEQIERPSFVKEYHVCCQVRAAMGVPIMLNGSMFGVLIVNQCSGPRQWQPFEIDLLKKLGTQVEIAIQQGQLYQQLQALAISLESQVEERTQQLQQRMQELQSLNQVKDILLHAVSHDLRTPVQGMLMVLNYLRDSGCETVSIPRPMLERMIDSSDRQLGLLNSLMENHTDTQGPLILAREPVYLSGLVENVLVTLEPLILKNQATIVNQVPVNLPTLDADPNQLQVVLENLLTNALIHNPPGRTVRIQAAVAGMLSPRQGSCLYCSVTDDGHGITQAQRDRLFRLYIRGLDNSHLTGIGLGLNRCQRIIAAHNGSIGVDSQAEQGATFWFTLPLDLESSQDESDTSPLGHSDYSL